MFRTIIFLVGILILPLTTVWPNAPAPQYRGPNSQISIETTEDLKDYSFFLISGTRVKEIPVMEGIEEPIWPLDTAPGFSLGTVVAVPRVALQSQPTDNAGKYPAKIQADIASGRISGMVTLFKHRFFDSQPADGDELRQNRYGVIRRNGSLVAEPKANAPGFISDATPDKTPPVRSQTESGKINIIAGILVGMVIIITGLFFFLKSNKRSK